MPTKNSLYIAKQLKTAENLPSLGEDGEAGSRISGDIGFGDGGATNFWSCAISYNFCQTLQRRTFQ